MAEYSERPLVAKLGIKDGSRITFVNAPESLWEQLAGLPENLTVLERARAPMDFILLFATTESQLGKQFPKLAAMLAQNGMIWIARPKKTSALASDLDFHIVQRAGLATGLVDVKICSIDNTWSAVKFMIRLKDRR